MKTLSKRNFSFFGIILLAAVMVFSLASCQNDPDPDDDPTTITYTVTQTGGTDSTADSTGIEFAFSKSVDNLTDSDITITGKAAKNTPLTGSGKNWTLPITVSAAGTTTVSITKNGIEATSKNVIVYKKGQAAPVPVTITWNLNGGTFEPGNNPPVKIDKGTTLDEPLSKPYKSGNYLEGWYTDSALTEKYDFSNPVNADLNLYAKWRSSIEIVTGIMYSVYQTEGISTVADTYGFTFDFRKSIENVNLTVDDIEIGGAASKGTATLTGSGTKLTLGPITVNEEGDATVKINHKDIDSKTDTVAVYKMRETLPSDFDILEMEYEGESIILISNYRSKIKKVTIPETINGKTVVGISNRAFFNKGITSVVIPETVDYIGEFAFSSNYLTSIIIPDSVISILKAAFEFNSLTSVTLSNNITVIEEYAFASNSLTSIVIPDSVTVIKLLAFYENELTSIVIPDSVTEIGSASFANNSSSGNVSKLTSITIGEGLNVHHFPFYNGFEEIYMGSYQEAAGTYTRPDINSQEWTKQ